MTRAVFVGLESRLLFLVLADAFVACYHEDENLVTILIDLQAIFAGCRHPTK